MKELKKNGYEVDNFISLIGNNNETYTIVYTSKDFNHWQTHFLINLFL